MVFHDMIGSVFSNKKLNLIVTELIIRDRKLNISLVFIKQSYFAVSKTIILNSILLWKLQTNENFNKSHLIIRQILTLKTLWVFKKII